MATDIDPNEEAKRIDEEEEQKRLDEEERQSIIDAEEYYKYLLPSFTVDASSGGNDMAADPASTPDYLTDYLNEDDQNYPDYPEEIGIGQGYEGYYGDDDSWSSTISGLYADEVDNSDTFTGYEDKTVNTDVVNPDYTKSKGNTPKIGFGGVNIGNTNVPMGPLIAGGAALTIGNNDDEETTLPLPGNGTNNNMTETTTTTPTYQLDPFGRVIPNSMAQPTEDDPSAGTLYELGQFGDAYEDFAKGFTQNMANVTGDGQSAFAQSVLGMEGDDISAFDIAREASRQQRGSLNEALGLADDASYQEMVDAGTSGMRGLNQVRDTVLPGLQSAFQESEKRLEQGLSGRQLQNVEQQARARFGNRVRDNAGFVGEVTDIASEDAGLYSRNLQDLLGISQTTSNLGQQEAYAMSPFTGAAISSSDLGPGLALAGDIGQQASAATPSPTDIFGLEAGERQFSLGQEALNAAGEAGRFDVLASFGGALGNMMGGGPNAGLVQNPTTYNNRGYTGQGVQNNQNNQYRFF